MTRPKHYVQLLIGIAVSAILCTGSVIATVRGLAGGKTLDTSPAGLLGSAFGVLVFVVFLVVGVTYLRELFRSRPPETTETGHEPR